MMKFINASRNISHVAVEIFLVVCLFVFFVIFFYFVVMSMWTVQAYALPAD